MLRSKNGGPYEINFDILFDRREVFEVMYLPDFKPVRAPYISLSEYAKRTRFVASIEGESRE